MPQVPHPGYASDCSVCRPLSERYLVTPTHTCQPEPRKKSGREVVFSGIFGYLTGHSILVLDLTAKKRENSAFWNVSAGHMTHDT